MENSILLLAYFLVAIACLSSFFNYKAMRKIKQGIFETLSENIKTLTPGNRYIITLPSSMTAAEFDEAFETLNDHLDLENSNTYVVIMHGDIRIVEFS